MRPALPIALLLVLPLAAQTAPRTSSQTGAKSSRKASATASAKKSDKTSAKARTPSSRKSKSHAKAKSHPRPKAHSEGIPPQRATQIESALVKAGYLDHVSGDWDAQALAAMKRYQKDHHWQEKFAPDSRALIALGLYGGASSTEAVAEAGPGSGGK